MGFLAPTLALGRDQAGVHPTHLCQAGMLVHHLSLVHGRQLLQDAPAVGQRPRQPGKLGPACRKKRKTVSEISSKPLRPQTVLVEW